jgi:hypothetical protein
MKKIISIICGAIVVFTSVVAIAASDRYIGEHMYDCMGFVELKDGHGGFKPEKPMSAFVRADEDSDAPRKFREVFEENGNRVNDPIDCHRVGM